MGGHTLGGQPRVFFDLQAVGGLNFSCEQPASGVWWRRQKLGFLKALLGMVTRASSMDASSLSPCRRPTTSEFWGGGVKFSSTNSLQHRTVADDSFHFRNLQGLLLTSLQQPPPSPSLWLAVLRGCQKSGNGQGWRQDAHARCRRRRRW